MSVFVTCAGESLRQILLEHREMVRCPALPKEMTVPWMPLFVLAVLTAAPGSSVVGQRPGEAFAVPVTADRIVLKLTAHDGVEATVTVLNGGMVRVKHVSGGTLALVPLLDGAALRVMVGVIERKPGEGESLRQVGLVRVGVGQRTPLQTPVLDLDLTWVDTKPPAVPPSEPTGPCTTCCITCYGYTMCACEVEMPCGRCCCPSGGCGCELDGSEQSRRSAARGRSVHSTKLKVTVTWADSLP
jgi:hypothetical protein